MKTKLTEEQQKEADYLEFLYDESQIDDDTYRNELIKIVGVDNVSTSKVLTGQYPGHTINCIEIK